MATPDFDFLDDDDEEASKKAKKKKLTKAEKERIRKEENERKKREEEERQRKREHEEKEKIEKEKQEREERNRLEIVEKLRRQDQLLELENIWQTTYGRFVEESADFRKEAKWRRYLLCDGSADPTELPEINSYINMWRDDTNNEIDKVLIEAELCLRLNNELEAILLKTPPEELNEISKANYTNTIIELKRLLKEKLDISTQVVLSQAFKYGDKSSENLEVSFQSTNICMCIWGNLSKNPTIPSHTFTQKELKFGICKNLMVSDCSVRSLFTKYDHYSYRCQSLLPRRNLGKEDVDKESEKEKEEVEAEPEEKQEIEETAEEKEQDDDEEQERAELQDLLATLQKLEKEKRDIDEEKQEEPIAMIEEEEEKEEEDDELQSLDLEEYCDFMAVEDGEIDLRAYDILGGIFSFELIVLPPQRKKLKDIVMQLNPTSDTIEPINYTVDFIPPNTPEPDADGERDDMEKEKEEVKVETKDNHPPIQIYYQLPSDVLFCEEPQVARWNSELNHWTTNGFSRHKYDEEKRELSFCTDFCGPMALLQDKHINLPYQSWEIRPKSCNHLCFSVTAAIVNVEFEVKGNKCSLTGPEESELSHFKDKWLPVEEFIQQIQASGINIFPQEDSSCFISPAKKSVITEQRAYQQMALTASAMSYSWSKWNRPIEKPQEKPEGKSDKTSKFEKTEKGQVQVEKSTEEIEVEVIPQMNVNDRIVMQGSEHLQDQALIKNDWSLFMLTKKRAMKLRMVESDSTFAEDHATGTEFHADMYHMAMEIMSDEGRARVQETDYHFISTVYHLLKSTRVLSYSA